MVAEAIHQSSSRSKGPFVKINCGALPESLLESELFGHRKGAFTGAVGNKPGRFQLAHNGTLYLTEIGDLPPSLQVKLLTFLDDKEIFPLGSVKGVDANVRIIAATHRNLEESVRKGTFRQDFYYRINVITIHVPPLRQREGDVALLAHYFLRRYNQELNRQITGIGDDALEILQGYDWPGNVRELENVIERAVVIGKKRKITPLDLPFQDVRACRKPVAGSLENMEKAWKAKEERDT